MMRAASIALLALGLAFLFLAITVGPALYKALPGLLFVARLAEASR